MIAADGDQIKPRNAFMTKLTLLTMQSTNKKRSESEFYKAKNAMVDVLTNICKHRCFAAQIARSTLENMDKYKNSPRVTILSEKQCEILAEFIVDEGIEFNY